MINVPPPKERSNNLIQPKYRSDIDGLRAIAVLSVICFHCFPKSMGGGFIGVDIFFVISGFLISTIIFNNLEHNSFSFLTFYIRRIRRIFPALLVVMISCLAFGCFILLADEYKQLGKHIAAGSGFISNIVFWRESGYFDTRSEYKPLLHLWSLGIEEQFYIIWPLILWISWKKRFNFLAITLVIAAISFALNVWRYSSHPGEDFYLPYTRFWELLAGALLAYFTLHELPFFRKVKAKINLKNAQSILGALLIVWGLFYITKENPFPGFWALIPTLGAVLIISATSHAWINRVILSNRVLVWFGLISFPLYLWHWPLLSYARNIEGKTPSYIIRIALMLTAILLAWLTAKLVEKPLRYGKNGPKKAAYLAILMTIVGCAGLITYGADGFPPRLERLSQFPPERFSQITSTVDQWNFPGKLGSFTYQSKKYYIKDSSLPKYTFFIGDSNVQQYFPRVEELINQNPSTTNGVIFATDGGCFPITNTHLNIRKFCDGFYETAFQFALSRNDVDTVVIAGQWFSYLFGRGWFIHDNGEEQPITLRSKGYYMALNELSAYMNTLKKNNKRVILVLNIPIGGEHDPKQMIGRNLFNYPDVFEIKVGEINYAELISKYGNIQKDLETIANNLQIEVIDPIKHLYFSDFCPSLDSNQLPIYRDITHLRASYVRTQASFIDTTVVHK